MSCSLELRAAMLDVRLVELGLSLPLEMKVSRRAGKIALREAFKDMLPREILRRRKRGFGAPLAGWLRDELKGVLIESLTDPKFLKMGIFRREAILGLINDHMSGGDDHSHRLWALLVLARWLVANR
jgi:asparagine synthase (glutamine-hydrolysing)